MLFDLDVIDLVGLEQTYPTHMLIAFQSDLLSRSWIAHKTHPHPPIRQLALQGNPLSPNKTFDADLDHTINCTHRHFGPLLSTFRFQTTFTAGN